MDDRSNVAAERNEQLAWSLMNGLIDYCSTTTRLKALVCVKQPVLRQPYGWRGIKLMDMLYSNCVAHG